MLSSLQYCFGAEAAAAKQSALDQKKAEAAPDAITPQVVPQSTVQSEQDEQNRLARFIRHQFSQSRRLNFYKFVQWILFWAIILVWYLGIYLATTQLPVVFPLGASFFRLTRQAELEALLKNVVIDRTVTFQTARLVSSRINWSAEPPEAYLTVAAVDTVTPKQIGLLEDFVEQETGRRFTLLIQLTRIESLRSSSSEKPLLSPGAK